MKAKRNLLVAAAVAAALGVGAVGGQAIALPDDHKTPAPLVTPQTAEAFTPGHPGFSALVKAVKPAVVNVSISGHAPGFEGPQFRFPEGSPFEEFFQQYFGQRGPFDGGQSSRGPAPMNTYWLGSSGPSATSATSSR